MDILFYNTDFDSELWLNHLRQLLPGAAIRVWQSGDNAPADYALVRRPPPELLRGRHLKAIFALGAGVDDILTLLQQQPDLLPQPVPLFRLEDAGMSRQMQEYALYHVLGWYRRFNDYRQQQAAAKWQPLAIGRREDFSIGLLGAGVLGSRVAESLLAWGFPVRCWSRTPKHYAGVTCFHGEAQLADFLSGTKVLINLLPNTPQTVGIINRQLLRQLQPGAYLINLARGVHVVDDDLLAALDAGDVTAAALDVFDPEPLPQQHPFWSHPAITITPHTAAMTLPDEATQAISRAIMQLENQQLPAGQVDITRGY